MENFAKTIAMSLTGLCLLSACGESKEHVTTPNPEPAQTTEKSNPETSAAETLNALTPEQIEIMNKTPLPAGRYPSPASPHYGPEYGSIQFTDTDPGPGIGGVLTMKPAVDETGKRLNEADAGITMYMIHWGLEVGAPGTADDKGAGDLGGDCMGFRDTGHVVMMPADKVSGLDVLSWELPQGTEVPGNAVYFVGHTIYGEIHNLEKCTQTPIENLVK